MEITKREVIASISILAFMLIIGLFISGKITDAQMDANEKYNKALKIENAELFQYAMDTNAGNAFVYGDFEAVDTVKFPEIDGEYLNVEKVKEKYTRHTRTVTYTVDGKTKTRTEVYWTWDVVNREELTSNKVKLLGIEFNSNQFRLPRAEYITTIKESHNIRYKYYGYPAKSMATIFSYLSDGNIASKDVPVYNNMDIDESIEYVQRNFGQLFFWIAWIALSAGAVYGFYYLDNNWLND